MKISQPRLSQAGWVVASILISALGAAAQTDSVRARVTEAVDVEKLVTLHGNTHPLARPEFDRGAAPDSLPARRIMLVLSRAPEQEAALRKLLDEQQIKSSPNFHRWLTPLEFGQQFGPADSDIQAATDWLTSQGFQVNRVTAGRTVIEFSGTAGQIRDSLHTEIHQYEVNGKEYWANASDPQIPSALSPVVSSVVSLNSFPRRSMSRRLGTFSRSKVTGEVRPLFTFNSSGANYAVGPGDFATIYNVPAAFDGTGVSIAIVATSNINIQDVRDFRTMFGLPANDPQIFLDGPDPGLTFSEVEADLDVQWAGAVAKNATIKLVISQDTETSFGADLSALYIVDNNIAPIMSISFGLCEAQLGVGANTFYNTIWQQAAAQGITVFAAAGDSGSATCDGFPENAATLGLAVDGLASTPYNVAVGGTDFNDGDPTVYWNSTNSSPTRISAKSYIPETAWNDSCAHTASTGVLTTCPSVSSSGDDLVAGGGGPSAIYSKPAWQTGPGVPPDGKRDLPDVSLFAGRGFIQNFYVYCQADANASFGGSSTSCDLGSPFLDFQGAGGTSFGAPAFASIMALVNQKTGARQGNANYVLYPLAAQAGASCASNAAMAAGASASTCIFYDTVTGNNSVACQGGTLSCSNTTPAANQFGVLVNPPGSNTLAWTTTPGYDLATGLGSVNVTNLVNNWASVVGTFKPTTTTLDSISPTTLTHGQPATVTIHVTSGTGGTPTGAVTLMSGANSSLGIPAFTLDNSGSISGATTLPGGTYNVTAHYAGDGTFGANDSTSPGIHITVGKEPSQAHLGLVTFDQNNNVTSTNAATAAYGSPYILRLDVTNASAQSCAPSGLSLVYPCPTGAVTFTDNGLPLADFNGSNTATVNSQGFAEDWPIQLPAGSHPLQATYGGDSSYTSSSSSIDTVAITQAATTMTLSASATTVQTGAGVTLTATINTHSNSASPPSGTVQFLNGATPIAGNVTYVGSPASAKASASLQATLTTTFSAAGTDTITAQFGSDINYANSTSGPVTITITTAPPDFTVAASPTSFNIASPGQSGASTLTVSPTNGFTGAVNFTCAVPTTMKEATCSLAPTSVTTSGTTVLTVTTTAPHTVGNLFNPQAWFMLGGGVLLGCLLLLSIPFKRRRLKLAFGLMCVVLATAGAFGCGGGSSSTPPPTTDPGTALGTYSVTVTATSGATSHSTSVSVTVQ